MNREVRDAAESMYHTCSRLNDNSMSGPVFCYSLLWCKGYNPEKGKIPGHDEGTWHSRADGNVDAATEDK